MKQHAIPALVLLRGVTTGAVSGEPAAAVPLHLHGRSEPTKAAEDALGRLGVKLLQSSNFNTAAHPGILKQSVPVIQDRYRRVVAGDCLIITYERPVKVRTVGGEVSVFATGSLAWSAPGPTAEWSGREPGRSSG